MIQSHTVTSVVFPFLSGTKVCASKMTVQTARGMDVIFCRDELARLHRPRFGLRDHGDAVLLLTAEVLTPT
jgi:hypothetical protein